MNLNDIIQAAQGGQGVANLGAQFGLTPEQAQTAVQALMPAFSTALQTRHLRPVRPRWNRLASGERRPSGFVHRRRPRRRGDERQRRAEPDLRLVADRFANRRPRVERERRRRADDPTDDAGGRLDAARRPRPFADRARVRRRARAIDQRRRVDGGPGAAGQGGGLGGLVTSLVGNLFGGGQSGQPASGLAQAGLSALTGMLQSGVQTSPGRQQGINTILQSLTGGGRS